MSSTESSSPRNAVSIVGAGKTYRVYRRPSDRLKELLLRKPRHQQHWALRDVSLQIPEGETFGLIGENGAGKSTFLKMVAGTLRPSVGSVQVNGRVAALLELGAGFHPEESGRENVMLMGAMNGVRRNQLEAYWQQVAEFSELPEDVLARPVKTYSSGMFMRLAFSAATAVEPDVLVIDEALSVGDMHFQKKSLDRIMHFREAGRTVLFCSHNLYQVRSLCARAAWIHQGQVMELGTTEAVVTAYEAYEREKTGRMRDAAEVAAVRKQASATAHTTSAPVRFLSVRLETGEGEDVRVVESFRPLRIVVEYDNPDGIPCHAGIAIVRNDRENVFGSATHFAHPERPLSGAGVQQIALNLPAPSLLSGDFLLSIYLLDETGLQVYDMAELVAPFRVHHTGRTFGMVHLEHHWELP